MFEEFYGHCMLCPRRCGADRTRGTGFCGVPDVLYVARAALHPWEEPCLCGEKGSGTVFFSGCSLGCVYCQNRAISRGVAGKAIPVERLTEIFLELEKKGAANINLVTPTHYTPSVVWALRQAKEKGLSVPVVYNTSGYERVETLQMLDGLVDIYLPDCKYFGTESAGKYSGCPDYFSFALPAIREMLRQTGEAEFSAGGMLRRGVLVRHLLLPGGLSESKALLRKLWHTFGGQVLYSLMSQYTPVGEDLPDSLRRRVTGEEYERLISFARSLGMENGYIQEEEAARESFIPSFYGEGV